MGLKPWDTAAGALLIQEAGGHISALDGTAYQHGGDVLAGAPRVHAAMLAAFTPHLRPARTAVAPATETGSVETA
jgi:myo-inositol-1(or 4)-monophosphatase